MTRALLLAAVALAGCGELADEWRPDNYLTCDHLEGWDLPETELDIECRCHAVQPLCRGVEDAEALTGGFGLGEGPRVKWAGSGAFWGHGEVWEDREEIIAPVTWIGMSDTESAGIWAFHWPTNSRRIISGGGYDPRDGAYTVGDGPLMYSIFKAERGPDGMIYTMDRNGGDLDGDAGYRIFRVDPDSGQREVVWYWDSVPGPTQCMDPNNPARVLGYDITGDFAVGEDGEFYMGMWSTTPQTRDYAIVRIAPDGSDCEVLSGDGDFGIGSGPGFSLGVRKLHVINGVLFAHHTEDLLVVDTETGDRTTAFADVPPGQLQWDPDNRFLWLTGILDPFGPKGIMQLDVDSGRVHYMADCENLPEPHPLALTCPVFPLYGNFKREGGWLLPDGRVMHVHSGKGFVVLEPKTGNNHHFNY